MLKKEHKSEDPKIDVKVDKKSSEELKTDCLIWLRDEVVHGNPNHVKRISQALGGE